MSELFLRLAVAILPGRAARRRYRAEFAAELHDLADRERRAMAWGLLRSAWALRAALVEAAPPQPQDLALPEARRRSARCLIGLHDYHGHSADDGGRYFVCGRCRRDHPGSTSGPNDGIMLGADGSGWR